MFCFCSDLSLTKCSAKESSTGEHHIIAPEECSEDWRYIYLQSPAPKASEILKSYKKKTSFILDIDEDFFGVHLPGHKLTEAGLTMDDIRKLENTTLFLFCPKSPSLEKVIDEWFKEIIDNLITRCSDNSGIIPGVCGNTLLLEVTEEIQSNAQSWFCEVDIRKHLAELFFILTQSTMTGNKLRALANTGLCLSSSWSTHLSEPHLHLCVGQIILNTSSVKEFTPSDNDLQQLAGDITKVLQSLPHRPIVITISRSSRNGYTPRSQQMLIENTILGLLKSFLSVETKDVVYSPNLAGGISGWDQRWKQ
ncbi:unnamed protein product [Calicophoron daubneyi]|uniref:Uncharacterized protein n=1 Tax=Calicophoron daubneyi TaxID=300641 RepID=A0AAV2TWA9_CALDB